MVARKAKKTPKLNKASLSEPKTMKELLAIYDGKPKGLIEGQEIEGKVVDITPKKVLLDIGTKSEGVVAEKAYEEAKDFIKTLKIGDVVTAEVIIPETKDGFTILSLRKAAQEVAWKKLEEAKKKQEPVRVLGKSVNPAGVVVDVEGLVGFIPGSQLGKEVSKNTSELVGKRFEAKVIDLDRSLGKVVLSEKAVSEREEEELLKKALRKIKEGEVYEGEITALFDFGCFVRIKVSLAGKKKKEEVSVEGLVHISELSWEKIEKPSDLFKVGKKVKVKVIGKKDGRLSLSIKATQEDPWEKAAVRYKKDTKVKGKIAKISDFGVFVQLEPGVEGLIHMTKIPPGKKLTEGEDIDVYIEDVDIKRRKISLGLVLTTKPVGYK